MRLPTLAVALLVGAVSASAQQRSRDDLPLPPPPPPPPPLLRNDSAPVPNYALEPPHGEVARTGPSLQPDLIQPRDAPGAPPVSGFVNRQDQLFREPAPGFRLRVPFSDEPLRR